MPKPRFSDRIGATQLRTTLQLDGMTDSLRNRLWNALLKEPLSYKTEGVMYDTLKFARLIADEFVKVSFDEIPVGDHGQRKWLRKIYYSLEWYEAYNLIEFFIENFKKVTGHTPERFVQAVNSIFEEELSGYRVVAGLITPLTNRTEIESVENAVSSIATCFSGSTLHLEIAIQHFSKRPEPDYRNSMKEAISAVESLVTTIAGEKDFARALRMLREKLDLHPAFVAALEKLFAYTSDEDGIRHGIFDAPDVGFDEAKFMLVTCSALVNFVISKAKES